MEGQHGDACWYRTDSRGSFETQLTECCWTQSPERSTEPAEPTNQLNNKSKRENKQRQSDLVCSHETAQRPQQTNHGRWVSPALVPNRHSGPCEPRHNKNRLFFAVDLSILSSIFFPTFPPFCDIPKSKSALSILPSSKVFPLDLPPPSQCLLKRYVPVCPALLKSLPVVLFEPRIFIAPLFLAPPFRDVAHREEAWIGPTSIKNSAKKLLWCNQIADVFLYSTMSLSTPPTLARRPPSPCSALLCARTVTSLSRTVLARSLTCLPPRLASTVTPRLTSSLSTSSLARSTKICLLPPTTWTYPTSPVRNTSW